MTTLRQRRESTDEKAVRLLTTGKLRIVRMDSNFIHAECKGDSQTYDLFWKPCVECPLLGIGEPSHLLNLLLRMYSNPGW